MQSKARHFPNLTPLRFFAAFAVIIHHVEQVKIINNLPSHWGSHFVYNLGKQGVSLFFVLSGFLITYLLLLEKQNRGGIAIKEFYIRRILRIWPLYFLIVALGIFVFPHIALFQLQGFPPEVVTKGIFKKLALFVMFLPNLLLAFNYLIPGAAQAWSIGTEEQFYLFWPWVFRSKGNKYNAMFLIIAIYLSIKFALPFFHNYYTSVLADFWHLFAIDLMAVGGILALVYFNEEPILKLLYSKWVQWLNIVLLAVSMFFSLPNEVFAVFFGILILNLATNENRILSIEWKPFNYLGKISYGIYIYHGAVIIAIVNLLKKFNIQSNWILYLLVLAFTFGIASLSYHFFELPFIKYKSRFTKIKKPKMQKDKILLEEI